MTSAGLHVTAGDAAEDRAEHQRAVRRRARVWGVAKTFVVTSRYPSASLKTGAFGSLGSS